MEGDADRGFARLLARLDAATRNLHCAEALEDELCDVLAQFRHCQQAMDHARQVDEATKSLLANAAPGVHIGSPAIKQHLSELQQLESTMIETLQALMAVAKDRVAEVRLVKADARPAKSMKIEEKTEQTTTQLHTMQSILTEQSGDAWLSEALEIARSFVRGLAPLDTRDASSDESRRDYTPDEQPIFDALKLLRKAVLKRWSTHPSDVAAFQKILKRLLKKRPVFQIFVERCDDLLAEKQAKALKKATAANVKASPETVARSASKSKKRRLSESSEASIATSTASVKRSSYGPTALADIRSKAQLCAIKAHALGDVFSLTAFDVCLKLMIEVVNALTPQFTADDTTLVSTTLFLLVDAVLNIKVKDKRLDRLVCLESLLSVLLSKDHLAWATSRSKKAVHDHVATCRAALDTMQTSSASCPTAKATPTKQKKKYKPVPSHKRFDA